MSVRINGEHIDRHVWTYVRVHPSKIIEYINILFFFTREYAYILFFDKKYKMFLENGRCARRIAKYE